MDGCCFASRGFNRAVASTLKITGNSFPHVAMRYDLLFALLMIFLASAPSTGDLFVTRPRNMLQRRRCSRKSSRASPATCTA